ncbi:lipase family protein [Enterobacter cancerogenus]|uniref:lipase family protein n=1 Tax=Enterobacter cancerogenus TaxID=69218 RepID=UPI00384CC964
MTAVKTSIKQKFPDAYAKEQAPYWVEIRLVDEEGKPVANMPWRAENSATTSGHEKELSGSSNASGWIRIEPRYGSELTLKIDAQSLAKEMEQRSLRVSRDPNESMVRAEAEKNGYIWHYVVIGELCNRLPDIEHRKGEPYVPAFHFPSHNFLQGFKIRTNELRKKHVIEICPFRSWELILHHQNEYSIANALNLGAAASLSYADDNFFDTKSITQFFITQCQDLSKLPQLYKGDYSTNTLVQDVPFSNRYNPPVFIDTSKGNEDKDPDGDTQLFYVCNKEQLIVSWRGTASLYDGGSDATFRPIDTEICEINKVQCTTLFSNGKAHEGFWNGYTRAEKIFSDEMDTVLDLAGKLKLFICGHSLGGSLALIHAAKLRGDNPLLYTYGMPRVFTRDIVNQLKDIPHYRHVNDQDPVPSVPPQADLDNELYKLWGPLGGILGFGWSMIELGTYQVVDWGDCFWHHGNTVAFLTATESRTFQECKITLPYPNNCRTLRNRLPHTVKLYLVPALAQQDAKNASEKQREFRASLTSDDLKDIFQEGRNPERGMPLIFKNHYMTGYMPYINNQLLELIDLKGLSPCQSFDEHQEKVRAFRQQMKDYETEIPKDELKRNEIFLNLEEMLTESLDPTLALDKGSDFLQRFALYGEEEIEQ